MFGKTRKRMAVALGVFLMAFSPTFSMADERSDWRGPPGHGKKVWKKKKAKKEPQYYIYYVPREHGFFADCPPGPLALAPESSIGRQSEPRDPERTPGAFPKESPRERVTANQRQRDILEKELATEHELLALARRELAEQQAQVGDGDAERLRPYVENAELHQKNVEALSRELSRIQR